MLKIKIDINCDLGESYGAFKVGNDAEIMPHITSANIACGYHAGDPTIMAKTIGLAKKNEVAVGAHPGFPDLLGFGRREMQLTSEEIRDYTVYQVSGLHGFAKAAGLVLQHVKPHGALYNMAVKDERIAKPIVEAARRVDENLIVIASPKSALARVAIKAGLRVACEVFADRAYNSDGGLVPRTQPNSVIHEPQKVVRRAVRMVLERTVSAADGKVLDLSDVHTICVHGDTINAVKLAASLKKALVKAGVEVKPLASFV